MSFRTLLAILLFLILKPASAEHMSGGTITYTCLGGNYFRVKLSLLRECSGFPMINHSLKFMNSCGVEFTIANLTPVLVENPPQICEAELSNSTCYGGSLAGFELYEFTTELYLSPCNYWTIFWKTCCRQVSLNTVSIPGLYIETRLNNVAEACSTAPEFNHMGVPRVCVGQPVNYDAGATDVDGHRLQYSFLDARQVTSDEPLIVSPINYQFPHYGGEPITGMTLDPQTGQIAFTPTTQGYIVVVVQVDEYNANNQWIGSVMRDFPFLVTTCSNTTPTATSGQIIATSGTATVLGERALGICAGSEACATLEFTDPEMGQNLSIWSSAPLIFPDVTVSASGTNPLAVDVCWNGTEVAPGSYFFVVTVMDDACPVRGARSFVYTVEVNPAPYAGMDGTALACALAIPFTLLDSLEGSPPEGGTWTNPEGQWHSGFFNGDLDGPGTYVYTYTEAGCQGTADLVMIFLPEEDSLCVALNVAGRGKQPIRTYPNPSSGHFTIEGVEWAGAPINLFDVQGRQAWRGIPSSTGTTLQLVLPASLQNGLYTLHGSDRTGSKVVISVILER